MALAIQIPADRVERQDAPFPRCPRCDYVLANIPEDRCPECGLGYSLRAVERVEHFLGTVLVREYQAAFRWSLAGLILAGVPFVLPRAGSPFLVFAAFFAMFLPMLVGAFQYLRAFAHEWAVPHWVWFSPPLGGVFFAAILLPILLLIIGLGLSGIGGLILARTTNIPAALEPLDSRAGRYLARWRSAAWATLALALLLQLSLIAWLRGS